MTGGRGREGGEGEEEPGEAWSWGRREKGAREKGLCAPPGHNADPFPGFRTFPGQIGASVRAACLGEPLEPHSVAVTEGLCVSFCLESSGRRVFVCILAFKMFEPKMP